MRTDSRALRRLTAAVGGAALLGGLVLASAGPAGATSATVGLTAGTLAFASAPPALSWSAQLNGSAQTLSTTEPLDVSDATGSGLGWDVTLTSTQFSSGSATLPDSTATVEDSPTASCDSGAASCSTALDSLSYPYTVPAGASAPTATEVVSAGAGSGMGDQTVDVVFDVAVPANATVGDYSSTWTFTLVSGP